jgi:DNA-binding NtrC family response regulator
MTTADTRSFRQDAAPTRSALRPVAVVAIADPSARQHAVKMLEDLRWEAVSASSGAQAFVELDKQSCQALLLDSWLPDLDVSEFMDDCRSRYPTLDLIMLDDASPAPSISRHPRRQELLFVLRQSLSDSVSTAKVPGTTATEAHASGSDAILPEEEPEAAAQPVAGASAAMSSAISPALLPETQPDLPSAIQDESSQPPTHLPEFVGNSPVMRQFTRLIRLVAPRRTPVLIEGATGTGKELTARAIHRLSTRAKKPMVVLNCAAIPEALLEAEVFGHTRGAFTGAVSSRIGRVEAANGGTLFLDEIGEMPLQLQSKLLRFLECGELQRVGENDSIQVDVRVIAATNQPLARRVAEGAFRGDLYYRLSVFPIATPTLTSHAEDIPALAQHFLKRHSQTGPAKEFAPDAMQRLLAHSWPGNVRELEHCIERAYILADEDRFITAANIQFGAF